MMQTELSIASKQSISSHWLKCFKGNQWLILTVLLVVLFLLLIFLAAPLVAIIGQIYTEDRVNSSGWAAVSSYLSSASLLKSLANSLLVSTLVTLIVIPLAFTFAYALTRSCMRFKGVMRSITLLPLLAPSLLAAISLIYWFGNQGIAKSFWQLLGFESVYGASGIVLAECFAIFPHVLMIIVTSLSLADGRLYEAAEAMGTSTLRKFFTVTLPSAKYGVISASLVSFTLVMTDFGVPKIVGGDFDVLATDIFRLIIGQQDFQQGAVVALLLLLPALLTFVVDYFIRRKQTASLSARAVTLVTKPKRNFDIAMTIYCVVICGLMLAMFFMAVYASFVSFWPYNLNLSLLNYQSALIDSELGGAIINSLILALGTTLIGTTVVFLGAYMLEKTKGFDFLRPLIRLLVMLPMAVPGLVLGLGYIFFFNAPSNPLNGLYQTMILLIICTVIHFYTTSHMTMVTALKAIDWEFEAVSASLKVPFYKTMWRVTLPICLPSLLDISRYFFINAMTTISAVIFLYSPETQLASVAILNLDDAGDMGGATAMAVMITAISILVTGVYLLLGKLLHKRTQRWRNS
ncbi:putative 2-aminoethylphosphonate ABC transporter permease subunit [Entomomonas asaccharolytica]|uniref:2-aminoethylphosphonate ABC transporter permease subunit n=1 Tax=Entomomonas asaccharolytica TaxID=2785331 RepID=A0A974RX52_9GAMM|nr:putative 2-aminoethylphosphonate ABC transporter permease subunit [Entomomonas asaccharolytica]QQP85837.1 putative 2-aminoethylphosphonate ABC transporter permease subunit [Entomomonas asaccharolytica]